MSHRHLQRKTLDEIALEAVEGLLPIREAAEEFCALDWMESSLSYLIPEAEVVERLGFEPPQEPEELAVLEAEVRAFFWDWLRNATDPERDNPEIRKVYPL